jgi:hypothetical protein
MFEGQDKMISQFKPIIGVAATVLVSAAALAAAPSASAIPTSAQRCGGDVCMYLSTPSNGTVYTRSWANTDTFVGYFHLTGPNLIRNSPHQTWNAGGTGWLSSNIPAIVGTYCVTGYKDSDGTQVGNICLNIE